MDQDELYVICLLMFKDDLKKKKKDDLAEGDYYSVCSEAAKTSV